jgi:hypothetical protein
MIELKNIMILYIVKATKVSYAFHRVNNQNPVTLALQLPCSVLKNLRFSPWV